MKPPIGSYRIRWAIVRYQYRLERMCIAERRYWFGWFPAHDAIWRLGQIAAQRDIEHDIEMRKPLPPTVIWEKRG